MYPTKAAQKRDLDKLNRKFSEITREMQNGLLKLRPAGHHDDPTPEGERITDLYFSMPHDLHQWRAKHSEAYYPLFAADVTTLDALAAKRKEIKDAPVGKQNAAAAPFRSY